MDKFFSTMFSYLFTTLIYLFILSIIRLIYKDIKNMMRSDIGELPHIAQKIDKFLDNEKPLAQLILSKKTQKLFNADASIPINSDCFIIGRSPDCDLSIDDKFLSARHLKIWHEDNDWFISDLSSTNGSLVNNESIDDDIYDLYNGDVISIGKFVFEFTL